VRLHETPIPWIWNRGPVGRLLKIAHIAMRRELEALTRQAGLTATQWSALGVLYHFPGVTNADLETILSIERPSVTSLIQGMERKGWVVRREHPTDARSRQIFLTDEGKKLAEETLHFAETVDRKALRNFSGEEESLFRALLEKLIQDLQNGIKN